MTLCKKIILIVSRTVSRKVSYKKCFSSWRTILFFISSQYESKSPLTDRLAPFFSLIFLSCAGTFSSTSSPSSVIMQTFLLMICVLTLNPAKWGPLAGFHFLISHCCNMLFLVRLETNYLLVFQHENVIIYPATNLTKPPLTFDFMAFHPHL